MLCFSSLWMLPVYAFFGINELQLLLKKKDRPDPVKECIISKHILEMLITTTSEPLIENLSRLKKKNAGDGYELDLYFFPFSLLIKTKLELY